MARNLTGSFVFTDNFGALPQTGSNIRTFHGLPGVSNNATITNDISYTRRTIYYLIKTYIQGVTDSAPYLLTPDYSAKTLLNSSSKTQVRHNYLHYEGDEIWLSDLSLVAGYDSVYGGLSRTSVDINRMFLDTEHAGPTGYGGSAWVSDRSTGKVFRHNLRNGALEQTFNTGVRGRGHGIGVDLNTGDCIATPGRGSARSDGDLGKMFRCDVATGSLIQIAGAPVDAHYQCGYGVMPVYGYPDRMVVTDWELKPRLLFHGVNQATTTVIEGSFPEGFGGYAAASCPNGKVIQAPNYDSSNVAVISPINAVAYVKDVVTGTNIGITKLRTRISTDSHSLYPHNILNGTPNRNYFSMHSNHEFGLHIPTDSSSASAVSVNWAIRYDSTGTPTPGYDGENNLWSISTNANKSKYYRTAGGRGVGAETTFPYGGESRYPTTELKDWPLSLTNTREIEWFLTRNRGVRTYLNDTPNQEVDASTLNNTISVQWNPDAPSLNQTAQEAWDSLVDKRMIRQTDNTNTYFNVYKSDGALYTRTKKFGVRMNVSEEFAADPQGYATLDEYYEKGSTYWMPLIKKKIEYWALAFANAEQSYIGVSSRSDIIEGNQKGLKIHPFYMHSTALSSLVGATPYYFVASGITGQQRTDLETFITDIRKYDFGNYFQNAIYMYSDFTGNILVGSVEATPVNTDKIHPATTNPSISLLATAQQSSPGYQDIPQNCYNWKKTIPADMSSLHTAITGYDDLSVSFVVSSYMGSYLITSYTLSTDDYVPAYLTDLNNVAIYTDTKNTSYNSSNVYTPTAAFVHAYHSPSMNGIYNLYDGGPGNYMVCAVNNPDGVFHPLTQIRFRDLYHWTGTGCSTSTLGATAKICVLERWSEPKFFLEAADDRFLRQNMFCQNTWGRACLDTSYTVAYSSVTSSSLGSVGCPYLYEGYVTLSGTVTALDGVSAGPLEWAFVSSDCAYPPFITYVTGTSTCSGDAVGYTIWTIPVSTTYFTQSAVSGERVITSTQFCSAVEIRIYNDYNYCTPPSWGYATLSASVTSSNGFEVTGSPTVIFNGCSSLTPIYDTYTVASADHCPSGWYGSVTYVRDLTTSYYGNTALGPWVVQTMDCGQPCGSAVSAVSGGPAYPMPQVDAYILGTGTGMVRISGTAYTIPDKWVVSIGGTDIFSTGYRGDSAQQAALNAILNPDEPIVGPGSFDMSFAKSVTTTTVNVSVFAPIAGTGWIYTLYCPVPSAYARFPYLSASTNSLISAICGCFVMPWNNTSGMYVRNSLGGNAAYATLRYSGTADNIFYLSLYNQNTNALIVDWKNSGGYLATNPYTWNSGDAALSSLNITVSSTPDVDCT
jgi:hypothetical protein